VGLASTDDAPVWEYARVNSPNLWTIPVVPETAV